MLLAGDGRYGRGSPQTGFDKEVAAFVRWV